jgi:hypothetical protein
LKFKLDNPPEFDIIPNLLDYDDEENIDNVIHNLTFKLPLKIDYKKLDPNDYDVVSKDGYLLLTYIFELDYFSGFTERCSVSLPLYYFHLADKQVNTLKKEFFTLKSKKNIIRCGNLIKGFDKKYTYELLFV